MGVVHRLLGLNCIRPKTVLIIGAETGDHMTHREIEILLPTLIGVTLT